MDAKTLLSIGVFTFPMSIHGAILEGLSAFLSFQGGICKYE